MASPTLRRRVRTVPMEVPLLSAFAIPIAPGKTAEFVESRRRAGIHERTFFQSTPMGDLVIVTVEGDDPAQAFAQMSSATDAFTTWFLETAKRVHGVDLAAPITAPPSELVADTELVAVPA